jgi:hypothetical protein
MWRSISTKEREERRAFQIAKDMGLFGTRESNVAKETKTQD